MRIRDLRGLGPKTEEQLRCVGVESPEDLIEIGAVEAFVRLRRSGAKPSLNFLYAMVGALEDRSWLDIAQNERESILMALDGFSELEQELAKEGIEITV